MGFGSCCTRCFIAFTLLVLVLMFAPGIPPDVTYSPFSLDAPKPLEGALAKNFILDKAERLYEGYLIGPESIASRAKNELFVSLHSGNIIRVYGNDFEKSSVVANMGPGCAGPWEEHICGRPLGLRFTKNKNMLVADSYFGIFSLDVDTGKKELLVDSKTPIGGKTPKLTDDLDVDDNGNIYWTDASSNVILSDGLIEMLSDPSGRFIKYDPKKKTNEILLKDLHFPNGVQLSPDQKFVLVAETFRSRVLRYWLSGPKAGTSDVFVSGLPGMPDNIRSRKDGGYYFSLVAPGRSEIYARLAGLPAARKVILRLTWIIQKAADLVNSYYPNVFCANFVYKVFHLGVITSWASDGEAIVVEVDETGKIIGSLHGSKDIVHAISETQQVGDYLFFGSPYARFLGRIHVDHIKQAPKPQAQKKKQKEEL